MLCKHHFSKNGQVFFHIFWVVTLIMQSRISVGFGYADAEVAGTSGFGAQMKVDPTNHTDDLIRAARFLLHSK